MASGEDHCKWKGEQNRPSSRPQRRTMQPGSAAEDTGVTREQRDSDGAVIPGLGQEPKRGGDLGCWGVLGGTSHHAHASRKGHRPRPEDPCGGSQEEERDMRYELPHLTTWQRDLSTRFTALFPERTGFRRSRDCGLTRMVTGLRTRRRSGPPHPFQPTGGGSAHGG